MMEHAKHTNLKIRQQGINRQFASMDIHYEDDLGLAWYCMNNTPRPCITPLLLAETLAWLDDVSQQPSLGHIHYIVASSAIPGVFNLGGDLDLFCQLIRSKNRAGLMAYAMDCIRVVHRIHSGLGRNVSVISLLQGDALGGGFETALSGDVIIAERSAKLGLPEILFNLFPGMGALSFLSRKIGLSAAEKLVLSGKLYSAQEMFEMGIVDVLAEDGHGEKAVYDYLKKESRLRNGYSAVRNARRFCNPVTLEELEKITTVWVDAALQLTAKDLRMMERLVKKQTTKMA